MRKLIFTNLKTSVLTFSIIFTKIMMSVFSILGLITINVRDDIANSSESELSEDASVVSNNMAQIGVDSLLFKNIVESFAENNNNFLDNDLKKKEVAEKSIDWFNVSNKYDSFRIIDEFGKVKVQIDKFSEDTNSIIINDNLGDLSEDSSFLEAKSLDNNDILISGFDPEDNLDIDVRDGKYISTFKVITPIIIYETGTSNIIFKCYLFYNVLTESVFKNILSTNVEIINNNGYYYFSNDKTHETYGFFNNGSSFEKWNDYNSYDPTTTSTVQGSKVGVASSISYYKINPVDISDSVNSLTSADINIQNTETLLIITLSKDYSINYFYKAIRIWTYLAVFIILIFSYFFTKIIDSIITNRNLTLDEYKRIANTDELTNLSNRKKAFNDLKDKLSKHIDFGLLFMDLDGFKDINDKYGHDVGDRVLIESANRFRSYLKEDLTVYRIGGDKFLVISENPDKDFLSETAKNLILVCNKPLISSGVNEKLGLSIGISYIKDSNKSLDKLIDEADNAMYEIKKDCKNSFKFFNE